MTCVPVILCGGSGLRLRDGTGEATPKQFLRLPDGNSFLQATALRAQRVCGANPQDIIAVTIEDYAEETAAHLPHARILIEPAARNTAPAVAGAALHVAETLGVDKALWILPADHHVRDEEKLFPAFRRALEAAHAGHIAAFGIPPTRPETGYGYIRPDGGFIEKPDNEKALALLETGEWLWNSGMFVAVAATLLAEYLAHAPDILKNVRCRNYEALEKTPFDRAIMEKTSRMAVIPCDPGWSDVGTRESLKKVMTA